MSRYLITDRFQTSFYANEVTEEDRANCQAGVISIIDLSKGLVFFEGDCIGIEEWRGLDCD